MRISTKTIGRLSHYRRLLAELLEKGQTHVYSHELARLEGGTAAQVRRDLMAIGCTGSPAKGYDVAVLLKDLEGYMPPAECRRCVLVGVGNLGRALLSYFVGRDSQYTVVAAFDADPERTGRVIHGCRCHPLEELDAVVTGESVKVAMLAVPVEAAQGVADALVRSGVVGLVNFAPVRIWVPEGVYVESVDVSMRLERASFYACQRTRGDVK